MPKNPAAGAAPLPAASHPHPHIDPLNPARTRPQQNAEAHPWRPPRNGETVYKTAVFLGSMIVVAMLLLILICMARWENIVRILPVFSPDPRRWIRRRRRRNRANPQLGDDASGELEPSPADEEQQYSMSNTLSKKNRSMNKRALEALPVLSYSRAPELGLMGTECTICLSDFTIGDRVRVLPDCFHGFHVDCVDVWLIAHASCPSCRSNLHGSSPHQQEPQQIPSSSSSSSSSTSPDATRTSGEL